MLRHSVLACIALLAFAHPAAAASVTAACTGEFQSASGLAGSVVGEGCSLQADSDPERVVQKVCVQGSICFVKAIAEEDKYGRLNLKRVLRVRQITPPQSR